MCWFGRSQTHDLPHDSPMLNQLSHRNALRYNIRIGVLINKNKFQGGCSFESGRKALNQIIAIVVIRTPVLCTVVRPSQRCSDEIYHQQEDRQKTKLVNSTCFMVMIHVASRQKDACYKIRLFCWYYHTEAKRHLKHKFTKSAINYKWHHSF